MYFSMLTTLNKYSSPMINETLKPVNYSEGIFFGFYWQLTNPYL